MQSMTLSKKEKQTCDNVRYFFNHDFERYKQLASLADLKSVRHDGINSSTNTNHQEEKLITASYYRDIVETVEKVIERMQDERLKMIMEYRYLKRLSYWQIAQKMQYSESTIKQLTNQALLMFAEMLAVVTDIDLRKDDYIESHQINE